MNYRDECFQYTSSGKIVGNGFHHNGLYILVVKRKDNANATVLHVCDDELQMIYGRAKFIISNKDTKLWHMRLGHVFLQQMNKLFCISLKSQELVKDCIACSLTK